MKTRRIPRQQQLLKLPELLLLLHILLAGVRGSQTHAREGERGN